MTGPAHAVPEESAGAPERTGAASIVVKFMYRGSYGSGHFRWLRQFPGSVPQWGACRFVFDPDARRYDWLAVYHDLPPTRGGGSRSGTVERLACSSRRTILVTAEPSTITTYGADFLRQYEYVLTSQEPECIRHPGMIHSQAGFPWFYGWSSRPIGYDALAAATPPVKPHLVSTVCSAKGQRHTLHRRRLAFTRRLQAALPELDVFGRGVRPVDDKAEALDPYRYHVAVENHVAVHHWTEKLADAFLGFALPFYAGCPNAADYFPPDSFIPVDLEDPAAAIEVIRHAIATDQYRRRLDAIVEARRRVLERYNLFAVLAREIERRHDAPELAEKGRAAGAEARLEGEVLSRPAFWRRHPLARLDCLGEKTARRLRGYLGPAAPAAAKRS